jgi:hypothetical protein
MHCTGVSIMVPAGHRMMLADTTQSLFDLGQLLTTESIPNRLKWITCAEIANIRNLFITLWYYKQPQASHLLMVDADMHFSPFMVWDMLQFGKPLVGTFYARREFPVSVVGKALNDTDTEKDVVDGHLKVDGVGGGVLLIKRSVIDEMIEKMPEIIDTSTFHSVSGSVQAYELPHLLRPFSPVKLENGGELSEDLSFCWRWRQCGGDVWANVRHPIGHVGPFEWTIRYEDYLIERGKAAAEPAADATPQEVAA